MPRKWTVSRKAPEYNCGLCEREDAADNMVQCDQCEKWYHYSCVGFEEAKKDQEWKCPKCVESHQQSLGQQNPQLSNVIGEPLRISLTNVIGEPPRIPPIGSLIVTEPLRELTQMFQRNIMVRGDQVMSQQASYTHQIISTDIPPNQMNIPLVGQSSNILSQSQRAPRVEPPSITLATSDHGKLVQQDRQQEESTETVFGSDDFPSLVGQDDRTNSTNRTNTTVRKNRIEMERLAEIECLDLELERQMLQIYQEEVREREMDRKREREIREQEKKDRERDRENQRALLRERINRQREYLSKRSELRLDDIDSVSRAGSVTDGRIRDWLGSVPHDNFYKSPERIPRERFRQEEIERDLEYIKGKYDIRQGDEAASRYGSVSSEERISNRKVEKDSSGIDPDEFARRLKELKFSTTSPLKSKTTQPQNIRTQQSYVNVKQPSKVFKSDKASQTESSESEEEQKVKPKREATQPVQKGEDPPSNPSSSSSNSGIESSASKKKIPFWDRDVAQCKSARTLSRNEIAARHVVDKVLDPFWGDPRTWPHFISQLKTTTKMCGYTEDENLSRLNKCLKGKAREKVEHQLDVSGSFKMVMWTLRLIFGRPELIVEELIVKAQKLEKPKSEDLESLVDFAMSVNGIVSMIEKAELPNHLSNPMILKELVNKLPTQERKEWAKHISPRNDVSLNEFGEWLKELAESIVIVTKPTFTKPKENKPFRSWKNSLENYRKNPEREQSCVHQEVKPYAEPGKLTTEVPSMSGQVSKRSCSICNKRCFGISECDEFKSYDIKKRWNVVKNLNLCWICLRKHPGNCYFHKACEKNGCKGFHHELLHDNNYRRICKRNTPKTNGQKTNPQVEAPQVNVPHLNAVHYNTNPKVLLRIVPVLLYGENEVLSTYAFMDDGSTTTLIEQNIIDRLKIRGKPTELCLLWSGKIHRTEKDSQEVVVSISSIDEGSIKYKLQGVKTVADLGIPPQSMNKEEMNQKYQHFRGIPYVGYENGVPGILIGSNNARVSRQMNVIEGEDHEPMAFKTRIGWSVYGPMNTPIREVSRVYNVKECDCGHDDYLHQVMKEHFSLENFGVQVPNNLVKDSKENEKALNQLKKLTKNSGDRFETGLLWKNELCKLPRSYNMAIKRLQHLEQRKPSDVPKITETIDDYVKKGYARKLTQSELQQHHDRIWYLPLFTVSYPKKPEKIRTVFDARAKAGGTSLNEMLLKGPDQMTSLIDILRRFREKRIAICGDIKEMFHQVKIRDEDQHCQRFLWRDGDKSKEPDVYVMNVMTFGATCSPSAAQYVKNLNAEQFSEEFPDAVKSIVNSHYVDDMMENADSEEAAIQLVNNVRKIHANGGFEIRNFMSNSKVVLEAIGPTAGDSDKKFINEDVLSVKRVLGMWWNTEKDVFTYSLQFMPIDGDIFEKMPTKREMLRILMSVFDPLGLISHFLIHLKLLVQEIWRTNKKWDEKITVPKLIDCWHRWLKILLKVEDVEIPRLYSSKLSPNTATSVELHVFVDASVEAFGAVCYLRIENQDGVDCVLVGSKTRVAPLKYLSIPCCELQAAVLGTRLSVSIISSQNIVINRRILWSDSATVLLWLRSDHRNYHQFVAHRVGEILENTNIDEWRWIPSKLNPADQLTKWKGEPSFDFTSEWFQGPEFLRLPSEDWPLNEFESQADVTAELKMVHSEIQIPHVIDSRRFSSWNKMVRSLAQAIRFVKVVRAKILKQPIKPRMDKEELEQARKVIFRQAQYEGFAEEMVTLKFNVGLPPKQRKDLEKSSQLYQFNPYLDDDEIIRMHGRIDLAPVPNEMKRPIILPRNNRITRLLVKCYHDCYHCRSHATVVNEIRQKFKIPQIRVVLKSVVTKDCQPCKNRRAKPEIPMMADLPVGRVEVGFKAFTATGIDYFGPIMVVDGRRNLKRWGVLFTCLTVRAVHIEIAYSLDTESCIMCIRNFINIRGKPNEMYSDNGTNFVGIRKELAEALKNVNEEAVKTYFEAEPYYVKWTFIPAKAKHMAGVWESMVKAVKRGLLEAIPTFRKPTDEMLRNLLMESMNIVNSRPLTYIPMDDENDEILTPNHFIHGTSNATKPPGNFDLDGPILRSKWQEVQRLTQLFWKRFIKEYLPEITRRSKWHVQVKLLEVGDIVLDVSSTNARNTYPMARIIETVMGSNQQVRRVRVQFANRKLRWRGASTLALLDIQQPRDKITSIISDITEEGRKKYGENKK